MAVVEILVLSMPWAVDWVGYVRCHSEVQDVIGNLASLVWGNVIREPVICEQSATSGGSLVADLYVQGVWVSQAETLLDIHVVDTDTQSYHDHTPMAVLHTVEHDKKQKYSQAYQACRATFTPPCVCQIMVCWDVKLQLFWSGLVTYCWLSGKWTMEL